MCMDFETKIGFFFMPKFYNLLLQINGRKCKRKGCHGVGGGKRRWETYRNREAKKEPAGKERDEIKCFLETH